MGEAGEVVLEPGDVDNVKMVGRLIEQEDVGLEEHSAGKRELHLPTTRERTNSMSLTNIIETDGTKSLDDLLARSLDTLIAEDELENRDGLLGTIDIVLDVEGADLVRGREALNLARDKD